MFGTVSAVFYLFIYNHKYYTLGVRKKWGGHLLLCPPFFKKWGGHVPLSPPLDTPLGVGVDHRERKELEYLLGRALAST